MARKPKKQFVPKERQEIYCHGCSQYVQFDIDVNLDGQHTIVCPVCGHEHYRIVRNGKVTEARWASSSSLPNYFATCTTSTATSTFDSSSTTDPFLYGSWLNTTDGTATNTQFSVTATS